jgi:hypothetical protein
VALAVVTSAAASVAPHRFDIEAEEGVAFLPTGQLTPADSIRAVEGKSGREVRRILCEEDFCEVLFADKTCEVWLVARELDGDEVIATRFLSDPCAELGPGPPLYDSDELAYAFTLQGFALEPTGGELGLQTFAPLGEQTFEISVAESNLRAVAAAEAAKNQPKLRVLRRGNVVVTYERRREREVGVLVKAALDALPTHG